MRANRMYQAAPCWLTSATPSLHDFCSHTTTWCSGLVGFELLRRGVQISSMLVLPATHLILGAQLDGADADVVEYPSDLVARLYAANPDGVSGA